MLIVRTGQFKRPLPNNALCCFRFSEEAAPATDDRIIQVNMRPLAAGADCEMWLGSGPVQCGRRDQFRYAHDDETIFASVVVPAEHSLDLERTTRSHYLRMDALLRHLGYPHWQRMWNYLPAINDGDGDKERYRQFNSGRHAAVALRSEGSQALPAASGVGCAGGDLVLVCIAGRHAAIQIENPRQVSAFCYPRQYGTHSPMFSRAALLAGTHGAQLLVSGTASIVGHESRHLNDAGAQVEETLANLRALLTETLRVRGSALDPAELQPESLKIYVRNPADFAVIANKLEKWPLPQEPPLYLQADICRRELLLEIEGTYQLPRIA